MKASQAYEILGAKEQADDEVLWLQYQSLVQDDPGRAHRFHQAITAIASARDSITLNGFLRDEASSSRATVAVEEPIGIRNVGNTCYLNSLLQYLFTINGVREIVLNFDKYKKDPTQLNTAPKRQNAPAVSLEEIERSQRCKLHQDCRVQFSLYTGIRSLAILFRGMIESPSQYVEPELDVPQLALASTEKAKQIRERSQSTMTAGRPSSSTINGRPALNIAGNLDSQGGTITDDLPVESPMENKETPSFDTQGVAADRSTSELQHGVARMSTSNPDSSDETLVSGDDSDPMQVDGNTSAQQQAILDNKENLSPTKEDEPTKRPASPGKSIEPLAPSSPSKLNVQAGALEHVATTSGDNGSTNVQFEPPKGPPPVPPRTSQAIADVEEAYKKQQDVSEVLTNCLSQLSDGITPSGYDAYGEPIDEIRELFYGVVREEDAAANSSLGDQPLPIIFASVAQKPKDIYGAIDHHFDLSDIGRYSSLLKLPPVVLVHIERSSYTREGGSYKMHDHINLHETIYMDRYMHTAPESGLMQRRRQVWHQKEERTRLLERKELLSKHVRG